MPSASSSAPVAEQEGMTNLFAGAIALYKNPQSHARNRSFYRKHNASDQQDDFQIWFFGGTRAFGF
jgi:hypothetical protein